MSKRALPFASALFLAGFLVAQTPPAFTTLMGQWLRTDGDYALVIKGADAAGKLEAGYFNPGTIRVSQATAEIKEGKASVFVKLDDTGYPGCTYKLQLSTDGKLLQGEYYQAAQQQTYQVTFEKK